MKQKNLVTVKMVRKDLENIPQFHFPPGFSVRMYRPGDAKTWVQIEKEAEEHQEITPDVFEAQFGEDFHALPDRMFFLCDPLGCEIGTAAAWYDNHYHGQVYGRVHWVAIVPRMQGKGLAKPFMTIILNHFKTLGHERAYLTTETVRTRAIGIYSSLGFVPDIAGDADEKAWSKVDNKGIRVTNNKIS